MNFFRSSPRSSQNNFFPICAFYAINGGLAFCLKFVGLRECVDMASDRSGIPQVVVLVPLTLKGHRDFFEGILRYARVNGPWRLYRRGI